MPCARLARHPERLRDQPWRDAEVEVVEGDVTDPDVAGQRRCEGVDVAYYLDPRARDRPRLRGRATGRRPAVFAAAARERRRRPHRLPRRPLPRGRASSPPHLRLARGGRRDPAGQRRADDRAAGRGDHRLRVGVVRDAALPHRAAAGDGHPEWVGTRIQPIAVRDVLRYLVGCAALPADVNRALRHRRARRAHLPRDDAAVRRGRRAAAAGASSRCRVLTPALSSHWVGLVTPVPASIARPLVESPASRGGVPGARHRRVRARPARRADRLRPGGRAGPGHGSRTLDVATRWSSAASPGAPSDPLPTDPDWAGGIALHRRARPASSTPRREPLWPVIEGIGGDNGWYSWRARLGRVRGLHGPARRRARAAARPPRPARPARRRRARLLARRGDRGPASCCGCGPRCGCRAWPGSSSIVEERRPRARPCSGSARCSTRAAWLGHALLGGGLPLPRHRVRRHAAQHRQGRRGDRAQGRSGTLAPVPPGLLTPGRARSMQSLQQLLLAEVAAVRAGCCTPTGSNAC